MNRVVSICQLFCMAVLCLTAATSTNAQRKPSSPNETRERRAASASGIEREAFRLINIEREKRGLAPLIWNEQIAQVARLHSRSMAQQHYFSHRGLDGSMVSDRATRSGVQWRGIGENIVFFQNYPDPARTATDSWMDSSGHKKNILNQSWQESGIGAVATSDGSYYLTQVFVIPAASSRLSSPAASQKAANRSNSKTARLISSF